MATLRIILILSKLIPSAKKSNASSANKAELESLKKKSLGYADSLLGCTCANTEYMNQYNQYKNLSSSFRIYETSIA